MFQILRVEKLRTIGNIASSGSHIFRERETKNADPTRTHLNHGSGARSSADLVEAVQKRLKTVTVSDDSVLCLEYVVTASPEFFKTKTEAEREQYFADALAYIVKKHGVKNVVCSDIQLDETTPHMSVYAVPIVEVEGVGTRKRNVKAAGGGRKDIEVPNKPTFRLSAKHFCDGTLSDLQTDFHEKVSEKFGLERGVKGSKADHVRLQKWYAELEPNIQAATLVIDNANKIKKEQDEREDQLKKLSASNAKKAIDLMQKESFLEKLQTTLNSQKEALKQIFDQLPMALMEKVISVFKASEPSKAKTVANPSVTPENTPKTPKTGILDVLKSPKSIADHQKPR
jgi:hypothetical protein